MDLDLLVLLLVGGRRIARIEARLERDEYHRNCYNLHHLDAYLVHLPAGGAMSSPRT
jgi:hypothetical protein